MSGPSITVVIPTFRRPDGLRRLLTSLAGQTDPGVDWQVLVVDNAGGPDVGRVVASVPLPVPVRVVHEPSRGASPARNRGIREVDTTVTVMIDDDVVPEPNWLASITAPILAGELDVTAGRVLLDPTVARPPWLDDLLSGYITQLDLGPGPRPLASDEYLLTANAAAETQLLQRVPFDERLGPRDAQHLTNDDLDLSRRLLEAGARVGWVPSAVVVHELPAQRLRLRWLIGRAWQQGRSDWRLDRESLQKRWLNGVGHALVLLRKRWSWRLQAGLEWSTLLVHLACDTARAMGFSLEAVRSGRLRLRRAEDRSS